MAKDRISNKANSYWNGTQSYNRPAGNRQKGSVPTPISDALDPLFKRENQNQKETERVRNYVMNDLDGRMPEITLETNTASGATVKDGFRLKGQSEPPRDQRQDMTDSGGMDENLHTKNIDLTTI